MSTFIAIIGIDGSGKSSSFERLLGLLAENSRTAGIGDAVWLGDAGQGISELRRVRWVLPKRVLGKLAKKSRQKTLYQVTKFAEMLCRVNVQNAVEAKYGPRFILTDGAPLINMIGWASFYYPRYFNRRECTNWIRYLCHDESVPLSRIGFYLRHIPGVFLINTLRLARFSRPDVVFFLQVTPAVAMERIRTRPEEPQIHETPAFLSRLQEAYDLVCNLMDTEFGVRVHRISVDELSIGDTVSAILERIPPIGPERLKE